jgi:sporulation protein YlmC with PRC-barrel domain
MPMFEKTEIQTSTSKSGRRLPLTLAALLGVTALTGAALAQGNPGGNPGAFPSSPSTSPSTPPPPSTMDSKPPSSERSPSIDRAPVARESAAPRETGEGANALIGLPVVTTDGQKIGDVAKVATDASGKVRELELKVGGFLGMGGKSVLVPGDKVNASGKKQVVLLMTAEQAKLLVQ